MKKIHYTTIQSNNLLKKRNTILEIERDKLFSEINKLRTDLKEKNHSFFGINRSILAT